MATELMMWHAWGVSAWQSRSASARYATAIDQGALGTPFAYTAYRTPPVIGTHRWIGNCGDKIRRAKQEALVLVLDW